MSKGRTRKLVRMDFAGLDKTERPSWRCHDCGSMTHSGYGLAGVPLTFFFVKEETHAESLQPALSDMPHHIPEVGRSQSASRGCCRAVRCTSRSRRSHAD